MEDRVHCAPIQHDTSLRKLGCCQPELARSLVAGGWRGLNAGSDSLAVSGANERALLPALADDHGYLGCERDATSPQLRSHAAGSHHRAWH